MIIGLETAIPIGTILFGSLSVSIGAVIQIVPSQSILSDPGPVAQAVFVGSEFRLSLLFVKKLKLIYAYFSFYCFRLSRNDFYLGSLAYIE